MSLLCVAHGSVRASMFPPLIRLNGARAVFGEGISASFQSLVSQFDGIYLSLLLSLSLTDPERASFKHYSPSHAYCHQLPFVSSATDPSSELHEIKLRLLSCVTLPRRQKAWMNFTIHQTFSFLLLWLGPKSRRVHRTLVSASDATPTDLLQPVLSLMSYSYCTQNWKHFLIKSDWLAFHNVQETVCACVVFLSAWKRGWCTEHF